MSYRGRDRLPIIVLLCLLLLLIGCNRKVLSVFFDGVPPESDSSLTVQIPDSVGTPVAEASPSPGEAGLFYHPPYRNRKCSLCHAAGSMLKMRQEEPALCTGCHEGLTEELKYVHGPVAGGKCTDCHAPHSSRNEHLLVRSGQALCLYCHNKGDIGKTTAHQAEAGARDCLECHQGHGGATRFFVKTSEK